MIFVLACFNIPELPNFLEGDVNNKKKNRGDNVGLMEVFENEASYYIPGIDFNRDDIYNMFINSARPQLSDEIKEDKFTVKMDVAEYYFPTWYPILDQLRKDFNITSVERQGILLSGRRTGKSYFDQLLEKTLDELKEIFFRDLHEGNNLFLNQNINPMDNLPKGVYNIKQGDTVRITGIDGVTFEAVFVEETMVGFEQKHLRHLVRDGDNVITSHIKCSEIKNIEKTTFHPKASKKEIPERTKSEEKA